VRLLVDTEKIFVPTSPPFTAPTMTVASPSNATGKTSLPR